MSEAGTNKMKTVAIWMLALLLSSVLVEGMIPQPTVTVISYRRDPVCFNFFPKPAITVLWSPLDHFIISNPLSFNILFASFFFFLNEFSFRCKPYYHRFQLGINWRYYSITSRKRRFHSTIFRENRRREKIQQNTRRWTPADAWKRLVQTSPSSEQLFWVGYF